jgi:hypothetical protein
LRIRLVFRRGFNKGRVISQGFIDG